MYNKIFALAVLLIATTACKDDFNENPEFDLMKNESLVKQASFNSFQQISKTSFIEINSTDDSKTNFSINFNKISSNSVDFISSNLNTTLPIEIQAQISDHNLLQNRLANALRNVSYNSNSGKTEAVGTIKEIIFEIEFLNPGQETLVSSLIDEMYSAINTLDARSKIYHFKNDINNSGLAETDKQILLQLAISSEALFDYIDNGGIQEVSSEVTSQLGVDEWEDIVIARTEGCSIDWRGVWTSAVVGGIVGGTTGAYIGATVGSFTVPILGTAAGGVGGAIYGLASGFVSGALTGMAGSLIMSCGRADNFVLFSGSDFMCNRMIELGIYTNTVCWDDSIDFYHDTNG